LLRENDEIFRLFSKNADQFKFSENPGISDTIYLSMFTDLSQEGGMCYKRLAKFLNELIKEEI
jgi:hypothetical protein